MCERGRPPAPLPTLAPGDPDRGSGADLAAILCPGDSNGGVARAARAGPPVASVTRVLKSEVARAASAASVAMRFTWRRWARAQTAWAGRPRSRVRFRSLPGGNARDASKPASAATRSSGPCADSRPRRGSTRPGRRASAPVGLCPLPPPRADRQPAVSSRGGRPVVPGGIPPGRASSESSWGASEVRGRRCAGQCCVHRRFCSRYVHCSALE